MNELITIAIPLITAMGGFELIRYLLNLRTNKRKSAVEVTHAQNNVLDDYVEGWKGLCDRQTSELERKDAQMDALRERMDWYRTRWESALIENAELKVEREQLVYERCNVDACMRRIPPRMEVRTDKAKKNETTTETKI